MPYLGSPKLLDKDSEPTHTLIQAPEEEGNGSIYLDRSCLPLRKGKSKHWRTVCLIEKSQFSQ